MEAELELSLSFLARLKDAARETALRLVQHVSDELKQKWSFIDPKDQNVSLSDGRISLIASSSVLDVLISQLSPSW